MQYTWHCSREIDRVISGQLDEDVGEWEELVVNSAYLLFHFYCVWDVGVCICYVLGFSSFHSVPRIRFFLSAIAIVAYMSTSVICCTKCEDTIPDSPVIIILLLLLIV